ncbi:hypothetical protein BN903_104 [Halorubrum sp. AJ67]|nr:hypothetical protein BN903_104 [Halorubrum sp. AJ67]
MFVFVGLYVPRGVSKSNPLRGYCALLREGKILPQFSGHERMGNEGEWKLLRDGENTSKEFRRIERETETPRTQRFEPC